MSVSEQKAELASKCWPPVLEDISTHGPLRRRHKDALNTMHQYDAIEEDYRWFRYSNLAAPCLLISLIIATSMLVLTLWQANGQTLLSGYQEGIPRKIEDISSDYLEGNLPTRVHVLKEVAAGLILPGLAIIFIFWGCIPKPHEEQRKPPRRLAEGEADPNSRPVSSVVKRVIYLIAGLCIVAGGILALVAVASEMDRLDDSVDCYQYSNDVEPHCDGNKSIHISSVLFTFVTAILAVFAFLLTVCCMVVRDLDKVPGWQEEAPLFDANREKVYVPRPTYDAHSTYNFLTIFYLLLGATTIVMLTFSVLMGTYDRVWFQSFDHHAHDPTMAQDIETPGWPKQNSQLRLAVSIPAVLLILFNFLPFHNKDLAWGLAFLFLVLAILSIVAGGIDIKQMDRAREQDCPSRTDGVAYNCSYDTFTAVIFLDFALFLSLLVYVLHEYVIRVKCPHCGDKRPLLAIGKHKQLCARRPVQCDVTMKVMTAKEFVYIHRWNCGRDMIRCSACGQMVEASNMDAHRETCLHILEQCSMCKRYYPRKDMAAHTQDCPALPVSCELCGMPMRRMDIDEHMKTCTEVETVCEACGERMPRSQLKDHLERECIKRMVHCELCHQLIEIGLLQAHMQSDCPNRYVMCEMTGDVVPYDEIDDHVARARATQEAPRTATIPAAAIQQAPRLGIKCSEADGGKLLVTGVDAGGPAEAAGVQVNDEVAEFNGAPMTGLQDFEYQVTPDIIGRDVPIVVLRSTPHAPGATRINKFLLTIRPIGVNIE